jgi:hypothetical protein
VVGSTPRARASATFSAAIAAGGGIRVGDQAGEIVAALGDRRHRVGRVDDEARQRRLVLGELPDQTARGRQRRVEVLGRLVGLRALAGVLRGEALDHALQVAARLGVERVEELVEVDHAGRRVRAEDLAVGDLLARVGAERQRDVAVGDARQRGEADRRLGAGVQRRVGLLDADRDAGEVVVGQLDLADRADPPAPDLDVVVAHQLAGVLEDQLVLVPAVAAQEQPGDQDDDQTERRERDPRGPRSRRGLLRQPLLLGSATDQHGAWTSDSPVRPRRAQATDGLFIAH